MSQLNFECLTESTKMKVSKYRGAVRASATGAIAPVDFRKYQIEPLNFEDGQGRDYMKFI